MPLVYASTVTSRCRLQDSRPGWIRYFLSCRALASPTTCRFIPALSGLPVIRSSGFDGIRKHQPTSQYQCTDQPGPIPLGHISLADISSHDLLSWPCRTRWTSTQSTCRFPPQLFSFFSLWPKAKSTVIGSCKTSEHSLRDPSRLDLQLSTLRSSAW